MSELPGQKSSGKEHFWGKIHLRVRFEFISTVIEIMSHSRFISSLVCKVVHKLHVNGGGGSSSMNHSSAMDQHECFDRRQNGIQDLYKTKLQEMPQITIDSSICIISSRTRRRQTCKQKKGYAQVGSEQKCQSRMVPIWTKRGNNESPDSQRTTEVYTKRTLSQTRQMQ